MKDFVSTAELNPPAHHDFFKKENPERNSEVSIELFQKCLIHMSFEVLCCATDKFRQFTHSVLKKHYEK